MADTGVELPKWYRVCLNTIVRKDKKLDSERLRILPMGSRVHVVQIEGRRVRIDQPIAGWCSISSSTGDTILQVIQNQNLGSAPTPKAGNLKVMSQKIANLQEKRENATTDAEREKFQAELEVTQAENARLQQEVSNLENQKKALEQEMLGSLSTTGGPVENKRFRAGDVVFLAERELGIGIVRFFGKVEGQTNDETGIDKDMWVGCEFDTDIGDSDGSPGGFAVPQNYAAFVKPSNVKLITGEKLMMKIVVVQEQNGLLQNEVEALRELAASNGLQAELDAMYNEG